ncbi:hypothetical protein Gotur_034014 [Gossypium turneri]
MGEDPLLVSLYLSEFWVQIHDLSPGLMTETMAKQFGDFLVVRRQNATVSKWLREANGLECRLLDMKEILKAEFQGKRGILGATIGVIWRNRI